MFWSFAYLVARNLFALVWILARPRRSKELEILVLRVGFENSVVFGSGLGLAIAQGLVEAQGGRIWAENRREGGGARVAFTLQAAPTRPFAEVAAD